MGSVRQLTIKELSDLIEVCKEYHKPIDYVVGVLASDLENKWILDASVSVIIGTDSFDYSKYVLDARFSGIGRKKTIPKNSSDTYRKVTISFGTIPDFFGDKVHKKIIYSFLESTSKENLLFYKTA